MSLINQQKTLGINYNQCQSLRHHALTPSRPQSPTLETFEDPRGRRTMETPHNLPRRALKPGAYAATLTFFNPLNDSLDVASIRKHAVRLVREEIAGLIVLGTNGEAPHLVREERNTTIQQTRSALDEAGFSSTPLIVGASAPSVKETLELCREAASSGGDYVLVLPPSYFPGMTPDMVYNFYHQVANESPVPVIIYSFPAVSAGLTMDSDLLVRLSLHPNILGTKFTCCDTAKLCRVKAQTPKHLCFGGLADSALPSLVAGADGFIAGGANIAPRACVRLFDLFTAGKIKEAIEMQRLVSIGDYEHTRMGIAGTKAVLEHNFGYGGAPRSPLQPLSEESKRALVGKCQQLMGWETRAVNTNKAIL
ncbi:hypothetical protein BKA56DRAFT_603568 [Ilyonectria sp. MPI-CAGE-AT-0026]|nr:hypothetical protein BKA56DRAFT_603568 [Ilyonectria sp. MPI-CAGE-AT-0026]